MQSIYRAILQTAPFNLLLSKTVSIGKPLGPHTGTTLVDCWREIFTGQMIFLEPN